MGRLRINKIIYRGDEYTFESPLFDDHIALVEGWNGTGKSTFCNLIYFGLGGDVDSFRANGKEVHEQIVRDTNNYVDILATVSAGSYILRRYFADNDITVIPYIPQQMVGVSERKGLFNEEVFADYEHDHLVAVLQGRAEVYPINRRGDSKTFSDWLMESLNISAVELFQGHSTFKVGFTDLMRLMYHDQQPDPDGIYKKIDKNKSTYFSDSEILRKAIFELLVGRSYSDYYNAIVEEKRMLREKALAKGLVDEYASIADKMRKGEDLRNIGFLQKAIQDYEQQLEKLHAQRATFKESRTVKNLVAPYLTKLKGETLDNELALSDAKERYINLLDERFKLSSVQSETTTEIKRIQKVIFSHDQLNLFTADTCPCCLRSVERSTNQCICGASIEEEQYERFFYTSHEYKEILKSRVKSLKTIGVALDSCNLDIAQVKGFISDTEDRLANLKYSLGEAVERSGNSVDIESLNEIDDTILDIREKIGDLHQLLEIETKLKGFQDRYDRESELAKSAELHRKELEAKAQKDIVSKVKDFSRIYNDLVTRTLPSCRSAKIRVEDYMPKIDDGVYREKSSLVPVRLMYYIALMKLSLEHDDVDFPRFLLIDTPETAGIEPESLKKCLEEIKHLEQYNKEFQVIITTGINKYPESLAEYRKVYMPQKIKEHMLLKEVNS